MKTDYIYIEDFILSISFSLVLGLDLFINKKRNNERTFVIGLYLFIASTIYVINIFENNFIVTIYRGVLSFIFITLGIKNDNRYQRAIGNNILFLTLFKILFYDIFSNINNDIMKVLAFISVGDFMIYISSLYKKYNLNLKHDMFLDLEKNFKNDKN